MQLAGGHVAANVNNPDENIGQWQAGAIRPLCVFAPERMAKGEPVHDSKGWADIPTCAELVSRIVREAEEIIRQRLDRFAVGSTRNVAA